VCSRHLGVGADGLILFTMGERRATMRLWNADGSASELSGNGLRCLAATWRGRRTLRRAAVLTVDTDAGVKALDLVERRHARFTFRAAMGQPEELPRDRARGCPVKRCVRRCCAWAIPSQCVVLGPLRPTTARAPRAPPSLHARGLSHAGTNVEFAHVEAPDRVRILIGNAGWARHSSGHRLVGGLPSRRRPHGGARRELYVGGRRAVTQPRGMDCRRRVLDRLGARGAGRRVDRRGGETRLRTFHEALEA
jgi:diaminopimelate epimerase